MPTQFMKLGFEKRVIRQDGFYNLRLNGRTVGFNLDLRLNYYRGLPLSSMEKLSLRVDGEDIPDYLMLLQLREKCFAPAELRGLYREYWGIKTPLHLRVFNYGLSPGEHEVEVRIELRSPYMQFAPGVFGMIDGSGSGKLTLQEERDLL